MTDAHSRFFQKQSTSGVSQPFGVAFEGSTELQGFLEW
jgi:hypothetical protein